MTLKHNGHFNVLGKLFSPTIIVGGISGSGLMTGSYQLPYPIGDFGSALTVVQDISGNKVLTFSNLNASTLSYTPSSNSDWDIIPDTISEALDILANKTNDHNHIIDNLETPQTDGTLILQPNGLGGVQWNPMGSVSLTNYYTKTETNAISGYLQSEIESISASVAALSANMGAKTFTSLSDVPNDYLNHAGDTVMVNQSETGLIFNTILYGTIECDVINQVYTATNSKLTLNSKPIVSLTIPSSGETQWLATTCNIRVGAFDVVLSDIPEVTGYSINWMSFNNI
jgi:hypothetical protein